MLSSPRVRLQYNMLSSPRVRLQYNMLSSPRVRLQYNMLSSPRVQSNQLLRTLYCNENQCKISLPNQNLNPALISQSDQPKPNQTKTLASNNMLITLRFELNSYKCFFNFF